MTEANYSNNDYYHYAYDAVGNRKLQTTLIGGQPATTNYHYNHANHLKFVNGVEYMWDDNGNLLNDGVNIYDYDSANRLVSFSNATTTVTHQYNGLDDRLKETVSGNPTTTFTMDLNAGLTQALSNGTNTYIYGNGRIAQLAGTGTEYFLGDALGSVRQMTNASSAITYAKTYDPYGVVTTANGASSTAYGYTGEFTSQGLVYLRSRMYAPGMGRFLTRDTWSGDDQSPLTLNAWNYTSSNPINYADPSGNFSVTCEPLSQNGWCLRIIWGWPPKLAYVPCDTQTQLQPVVYSTPTATPQPPTATPNSIPITTTPVPTQVQATATHYLSVKIYRELSRKDNKPATNPGQFSWDPPYGVSTFEFAALPGVKPYIIGYTVIDPQDVELDSGKKVIQGSIPEVPECVGTYDPPPPGHWSIDCGGPVLTPPILGTDAKLRKATIILNPNYKVP